jgi:hypothetical protein
LIPRGVSRASVTLGSAFAAEYVNVSLTACP